MELDNKIRKDAVSFFLHSPADSSQSYVNVVEQRQGSTGITYGCVMDKQVIPLKKGDLMAVVARPGHGKSSWMAYMAKRTALDISRRKADDEVVLYVSWEQTIEEIEAFFQSSTTYSSTDVAWGRVPMDEVRRGAIPRAGLPIWMVGLSQRHEGISRPRMYIEYIYAAIEEARETYGKNVVLACLDYVQIIPTRKSVGRMEQVDEAVNGVKELAMHVGTPVIVGVQASRRVDSYDTKIPAMSDAQWSSAIEQVADKQIALWRPIKSISPDESPYIDLNGVSYKNDSSLLIIRLLKQRFETGAGTWAVNFKPESLEMTDFHRADVNTVEDIGF